MSNNKAIGYIRVSSQEQSQNGLSLADQRQRIIDYCKSENLDLVDIFADDGVSAAVPLAKRPEGVHVVELLENGADCLVALKLDRLFRSTLDCLNWTEKWESRGKALHLLDFGGATLKTDTAMGKFFLTVMAAIGELERQLIGERIANVMERKAINGEWHGGPLPLGYKYSGFVDVEKRDGTIVRQGVGPILIDRPNAEVVQDIFAMKFQGMSVSDIIESLIKRGFKTPKGKHLGDVAVRRILRNRSYIGEREYNGEIYQLNIPAIIDKQVWEKINW